MSFAEPLAAFGRSLGLEALALNHDGLAQLLLDDERSLTIEATDDALLVYLTVAARFVDTPRLIAALQSINLRRLDGPALQLALRGSGGDAALIVLTRLTGRSLAGSDIGRAVEALVGWHAQWQNS